MRKSEIYFLALKKTDEILGINFLKNKDLTADKYLHCTPTGARRRSVIMTVLASLQTRFARFTLENLLAEVQRWFEQGRSIFELELAELQKANASPTCKPALLPNS